MNELDRAWHDLENAVSSLERDNGREYTVVLIPHNADEPVRMSVNGKPVNDGFLPTNDIPLSAVLREAFHDRPEDGVLLALPGVVEKYRADLIEAQAKRDETAWCTSDNDDAEARCTSALDKLRAAEELLGLPQSEYKEDPRTAALLEYCDKPKGPTYGVIAPKRPYIGVTGFTTQAQVREAIEIYRKAWGCAEATDDDSYEYRKDIWEDVEPTHDLMIGVLVSDKTLAGGTNKYPRRYPPIEQVRNIFIDQDYVLNLVHYAGDKSFAHLSKLGEFIDDFCHGFQFNGTWPAAEDLEKLFAETGRLRVVLQVTPRDTERLKDFEALSDLVTDALMDASAGKGLPLDPAILPVAGIVSYGYPRIRAGVAGGLCADSLTPEIGIALRAGCSIDAEGRLRDSQDGGGELDMSAVRDYLNKAVALARGLE